jgi:carbamoyl-phosphate synthase/aspartate carbamoyltransferase/dihydroorotase
MSDLVLPGLADVHTHLRVPGGEHKEDFITGTAAALAGGVTSLLAMPNTTPPLTTPRVLQETRQKAQRAILCDVGLFAGASPREIDPLPQLSPFTVALKIYLNETFGPSELTTCLPSWPVFNAGPYDKLIAMHAEGPNVAVGIGLSAAYRRPVHFCHISRKAEIEQLLRPSGEGCRSLRSYTITCF